MKRVIIGTSVKGVAIELFMPEGTQRVRTLIIAGVHGDETEGVVATQTMLQDHTAQLKKAHIAVIPIVNPDGYNAGTRQNSRGIDLNRNLPTKDWTSLVANERYFPGTQPNSEPENQSLIKYVDQLKPELIISLHSYTIPMLNSNGDCAEVATKIAKKVGYPVSRTIGYPTPGCLGTYYGLERNIPVITYEFLRGMDHDQIQIRHAPAIVSVLIAHQ